MRALTTLLAVVLIALGVGLWLGTGRESMTAISASRLDGLRYPLLATRSTVSAGCAAEKAPR